MKTEKMGAIVGIHGLYIGTWFTRREAISGHIADLHRAPFGGVLTRQDIKRLWDRRKKIGDRAVKVEISYES